MLALLSVPLRSKKQLRTRALLEQLAGDSRLYDLLQHLEMARRTHALHCAVPPAPAHSLGRGRPDRAAPWAGKNIFTALRW